MFDNCRLFLPQVFKLTGAKKSTVAGCTVKKGKIFKAHEYVVLRNGVEVFRGGWVLSAAVWTPLTNPLSQAAPGR